MRAIMVMFDSLNRHMLPPYGYKDIVAPNFERLAQRTITFDNCYAGSLPCMPARRELHTGRYNFLHRSWGPLEPYDDSMPEILKNSGIYTHLTTDHWHYWEEGGLNYQTKYNTFEFVRGQEGDCWKGRIKWDVPPHIDGRKDACGRQEYINRYYMREEANQSIAVNFSNGLEFIQDNYEEDNWYLQLENFDPHEPFFTPQNYKDYYKDGYNGIMFDWPGYHEVAETPEQVQHCINEYKALVTMCDTYLGKVLDLMDKYDMWKDTMLIVNTDHGFILSEHNWWGKVMMPYFNEIAHTPLFIWDPRVEAAGERRQALVQTIDLAPTVLEFFGEEIPENMQGVPLYETLKNDKQIREYALFGQHGVHVNITDGRYVYMRCPLEGKEGELFNYVIVPSSYPGAIGVEEMNSVEAVEGFDFMKGMPVWKMQGGSGIKSLGFPPKKLMEFGTLLYDLWSDPKQENPIKNSDVEERMKENMVRLMMENDAPKEQYARLGLEDIFWKWLNYKGEINMAELKGTPHNSAVPGEIAEIVLMPGDPLRAKLIAENYLENVVCYNTVRNIFGYTGEYKGKRISVQASGMGIPSMGIYSYELFNHYGVEKIIRIGSAGAISDELKLGDIVVAAGICTDSNYISQYKLPGLFTPNADFDMLQAVVETSKEKKIDYKVGTVFTSDVFYNEDMKDLEDWKKMNILCVEMESVSLYCNALRAGKKALSMFTISDIPLKGISMEADARRTSFTNMMEVALDAAIKMYDD